MIRRPAFASFRRKVLCFSAALAFALFTARDVHAQTTPADPVAQQEHKRISRAHPSAAASSIQSYLDRVRKDNLGAPESAGSTWSDSGLLARVASDTRSFRTHDLIAVVVSENLTAETDGAVKGARASTAASQVSAFFTALSPSNSLNNLINQQSSSSLNASGQSASNSSLSTVLGGEVVEVLPNGILVIEAARQVEFSHQAQTIVLRGLVRPEDVSAHNQVLSTAISSLELEVKGRGIVDDYTHRPNPFVRLLQQLLIF